jgi:hypothetical protein
MKPQARTVRPAPVAGHGPGGDAARMTIRAHHHGPTSRSSYTESLPCWRTSGH